MDTLTVADFYKQTGTFQDISKDTIDCILAGAENKLERLKSQGYDERAAELNEIITKVLSRNDQLSTFITMEISQMLSGK